MSIRLAFGVTTGPGSRTWLPTPGGAPIAADDRTHRPGAPVAVGPADAVPDQAVEQLTRLPEVAAGAGVDLGDGFTSARLAGAPGDRRDAVLAALKYLSAQNAHRLGDRTAVLVALFGLSATKRVGAAANKAISEERWAALQLASAGSDLLGPEQLEHVLTLQAPEGIDPFPQGAASTLADHLSRVLSRYQRPRRLALVVSLWDHVCAGLLNERKLATLVTTQVRTEQMEKLRERHQAHLDEPLVEMVTRAVPANPTVAAAARWRPPPWWSARELTRLLHDAIAATALLRFAKTLSFEGLAVAAERHRDELAAADACLTKAERNAAARRVEGAYSHPARPGRYVHDLLQPLRADRKPTQNTEKYVRERVALARNYGMVVMDAVGDLLLDLREQQLHNCWDACKPWQADNLRQWRDAVGFFRDPAGWEQPPLTDANPGAPTDPLAQRLAADPAAQESPHDLLWYADLADALAPYHGHDKAGVRHERNAPDLNYNPRSPTPRPRTDTVPLAAASVAQLVAFGATPPPRCGSWADLVEGVRADAVVAEASVGTFPLPPEVSELHRQTIPGTSLVVELGRDPRQLADWSSYMGNCIGEQWYVEDAQKGQCILMALRDDGRIVANLDLRRGSGGWKIHELRARFNESLDPALTEHITSWVKSQTRRTPPPPPAIPEPQPRARGGIRRSPAVRLPAALVTALTAEVTKALSTPQTTAARRTYTALMDADFEPEAAVIALKRLTTTQQADLLRKALPTGLSASTLWRATATRPLTAAIGDLPPDLHDYDRLTTLTTGEPLLRTLRALVRRPEIAPAHALDTVGRAIRTALGTLLSDEALARSVSRRPSPELVCALVIATTCAPKSALGPTVHVTPPGTTTVPGFPTTTITDEDGPWHQALPAAAELGAEVELFTRRAEEEGLQAPAALLGRGGWPALWQRANR
jgi:hypothetical protein